MEVRLELTVLIQTFLSYANATSEGRSLFMETRGGKNMDRAGGGGGGARVLQSG